jgi:hypothetical protein
MWCLHRLLVADSSVVPAAALLTCLNPPLPPRLFAYCAGFHIVLILSQTVMLYVRSNPFLSIAHLVQKYAAYCCLVCMASHLVHVFVCI